MRIYDLFRRVKNALGAQNVTLRRIGASAHLAVSLTLPVQGTPLTMEQLFAPRVSAQVEETAAENEQGTRRQLVLSTDLLPELIRLAEEPKPAITVTESRADERARKEREEAAKHARAAAIRSQTVTTTGTPSATPADVPFEVKRALAVQAAAAYGIDWRIVEAVWQIESGKRWKTDVRSSAGAQGPMQFMPGTWRAYAVDGNGDGVADITDARDAVFAGARYLAANGAATNVDNALFRYNHAQWYVDKVKALAYSL
ncbi:MAG: lytic transglycosylase domain-containing protein [Patescibacteria group bacterium]|jgi:membrane-bound lytic murein transglycosylase B